ncbi:MAG TPA: DUF1573 domain-containing protein [Ferruginibacter sp.]|nr:DUF1573 domain-containing protein [Ferruginibacter sp.]
MKKLILSIAAFSFASVLFAQKTAADVAKFDTETINQGTLKQNEPKEVRFVVTNVGKEPLIIEQANPTCGCTMGDYTKTPIAPGATGFISAKFNAANAGHFDKHLTVKFAGVDELKSITITGDVLTPEDYDKWAAENEAKKKAEAPAVQPAAPAKAKAKTKVAAKG